MKKGIKLILLGLILITTSCEKHQLDSNEWIKYVENEDNGLKSKIATGEYLYTFQYKPLEYIVLKELNHINNKVKFNKRLSELKKSIWFNVSISSKGSEINPLKENSNSTDDYNKTLSYFNNSAMKNFTLTYGNQEMNQIGYYFENTYGLTPNDVMIIGFNIPDSIPKQDIQLSYDDKIYQNGLLKIKITKKEFKQIPTLKF